MAWDDRLTIGGHPAHIPHPDGPCRPMAVLTAVMGPGRYNGYIVASVRHEAGGLSKNGEVTIDHAIPRVKITKKKNCFDVRAK